MATDDSKEVLRGAVLLCMELYGEDETRVIMQQVYAKIDATGLDGAFIRDWLLFTKSVAVSRHPETAAVWNSVKGLEKSNVLPTH